MYDLTTPIEQVQSVGARNAPRLRRLGITTVRDLLWHLPSRYEDYSERTAIGDLEVGSKASIQGEVIKTSIKNIFPRRMTIVEVIVKDDSGAVKALWFNQPYVANALAQGALVNLAGKVQLNKRGMYLSSPTYEKVTRGHEPRHTSGYVAVYPETEGITSKYLRFLIKPLLEKILVEDSLPASVRQQYNLLLLADALRTIHAPEDPAHVADARRRLAFDDLLLFQLKALTERRKVRQQHSKVVPFDAHKTKAVIASLPFTLTADQKIAAWEIFGDLGKPYPMNRLLEGDVGSGKTVVAFLAACQVADNGLQTVFLAPTEVLAHQHAKTIEQLAYDTGITVGLLTSSQSLLDGAPVSKQHLKSALAAGDVDILIGTHAVLQKDVQFHELALVVVDEQHRFGIEQRAALLGARTHQAIPHLLSMTATPIPRTLALTIFGDLDISLIKTKPHDRKEIVTEIIAPDDRAKAYKYMDAQIEQGRQIFFICPRIEVSTDPGVVTRGKQQKLNVLWQEVAAVTQAYEKLSQEIFPHRKIVMLHGKMKPKEKQSTMMAFKDGWYDVLVATSVVEVGVDIPNATVMAIENADRFGLAQLHQFRGRVGRSSHQSRCFLFATDAQANKRLQALQKFPDGFTLAEQDMALRGPGEFFGLKQSGMPDLTMAALADVDLIKKARLTARTILARDPLLQSHPLLVQRLAAFQKLSHFE